MHRAKEGDREGYIERVREREGKRERYRGWERDPHNLEREASKNRGKGWVNAKIGWTFVTLNDLWGHTF